MLKARFPRLFAERRPAPKEASAARVRKDELTAICARRRALGLAAPDVAPEEGEPDGDRLDTDAWRTSLIGLALSGGGIRSATFNLGVLQALAGYGLLRRVDYLSTVSGGGYIGGWLTALLQRTFKSDAPDPSVDGTNFRRFERRLAWSAGDAGTTEGADREHGAIRFLREFSNYLTPKLGVLSGDTWALFSTYVRNAALNQLIIVLALSAVMLVPRLVSDLLSSLDGAGVDGIPAAASITSTGVLAALFLLAAWNLGRNLAGVADTDREKPNAHYTIGVVMLILLPVLGMGVLVGGLAPLVRGVSATTAVIGGTAAYLLIWIVARIAGRLSPWSEEQCSRLWNGMQIYAVLAGLVFALVLLPLSYRLADISYAGFRMMLAPPLVILALLGASILHIGLAGNRLDTYHREWLSRLGGLLTISGLVWAAVAALAFLSPVIVDLFPAVVNVPLLLGWIATTLGGVYAGRTSRQASAPPALRRLVMVAAPWVFVAGLLVVLSAGLQAALHSMSTHLLGDATALAARAAHGSFTAVVGSIGTAYQAPAAVVLSSYGDWLAATERAGLVLPALLTAALAAIALSFRVDINSFSLHNMYANRLIRCYLGASCGSARADSGDSEQAEPPQQRRWPNPFTKFAPGDDLDLAGIATDPCPGPYPLINTAINLNHSERLAWQERKAASFLLSPRYCGFAMPGTKAETPGSEDVAAYRPTREFSRAPKPLSLGEAIATSGAAASPNMGYHTTPALSLLLGIFNFRLGRWAPNPRKLDGRRRWRRSAPRIALWHLLREVLGMTDDRSEFVYLSDGGHFENLGIYELVRRRCRYVVVCDSGADGGYEFEDLGNAVRKCRIDLGVEIDVDIRRISRVDEDGCNGAPCAVGKIRYSDDRIGTLLYIKSTRYPGAPSDVLQYARQHPAFPHETTSDQFFSESQFESYRRLGHYLTTQVLERAFDSLEDGHAGDEDVDVDSLFRLTEQNWYPESSAVSNHFSTLTTQIDNLFERLRTSPELDFLSEQIYPEWRTLMSSRTDAPAEHTDEMWLLPKDEERLRHGFYFCNSLIQLMENVYLDLKLESEWRHPDNSGWMNVFRHWTWSSMFRVSWAVSAATYGQRFRAFCEQRLRLKAGRVRALPVYEGPGAASQALEQALAGSALNVVERSQIRKLLGPADTGDSVRIYRLELRVPQASARASRHESDPLLRSFAFGYALVVGSELRMFRVQDHLRSMDLGRCGLESLVDTDPAGRLLELPRDAARLLRLVGERPEPPRIAEFRSALLSIRHAHGDRPAARKRTRSAREAEPA